MTRTSNYHQPHREWECLKCAANSLGSVLVKTTYELPVEIGRLSQSKLGRRHRYLPLKWIVLNV